MANQEIIRYIKEQAAGGASPERVKDALKAVGWPEKEIMEALAAVEASGGFAAPAAGRPEEIRAIRSALDELNRRLARLEAGGAPLSQAAAPRELKKEEKVFSIREGAVPPEMLPSSSSFEPPRESVETKITGKWFAGLGILAILVGIGFFLKYAFENNLIGVTGRIILGVVVGLVLLVLGDILSRKEKYKQFSFFISGGGLAVLYLSIYAAFNYYHLISQTAAFIFMILVTAAGAILSLKSSGKILAGISLLGGFLTPFLVSTGTDNQIALFGYITVLNLSFLGVSMFKKWNGIYVLNFLGTYATFFSWLASYYAEEKLAPTIAFLTLFFVIFLLAPFLTSILRRIKSENEDVILSVLNAGSYFITAYVLLKPDYEPYLGFFFVLWAALCLAGASLISRSNPEDKTGVLALGGIGLVLVTVAVPVQLSGMWITVAWAVEAALLLWFGFGLKSAGIRTFADIVSAIAVVRLFFFE
ncbi:MAG: DUF2339 domain-containing protein, partial [Patescibacteria group bacterium]